MKYAITWFNDKFREQMIDEFATLKEAKAELATFKEEYPWNTYYLVKVLDVVEATEKSPTKKRAEADAKTKVTISGGGGGTSGIAGNDFSVTGGGGGGHTWTVSPGVTRITVMFGEDKEA